MTECHCGTEVPPTNDLEAWENFTPRCRHCKNRKVNIQVQHLTE